MSKLSLSVFLNAYDDAAASNAPSRNPIKWARDLQSILVNNPKSEDYTIAPGETRSLFSGTRTLNQDLTTRYDLSLKPLATTTYVLAWSGIGTAPDFRTPRNIGDDATTQVNVTTNGPVVTFTSTGMATQFDFSTVVIGDYVTIGNVFNLVNQGTFQIISKDTTSVSVVNALAVAEGPVPLGSGFADQFQVFSAAGVQVGDTLIISAGFSPVSWGSYEITAVYAESIEFSSTAILPQESQINTEVAIYSMAKQLIYMEASAKVSVSINGGDAVIIEPFQLTNCLTALQANQPGMLLLKSTIYSLDVTNSGIDPVNVFLAAVE